MRSIAGKWKWFNIWLSLCWLKKSLANRVIFSDVLRNLQTKPPENLNRVDYILDFCSGKTVLHIGFSDYPYTKQKIVANNLLHLDLKKIAKQVWGLDNNIESIREYTNTTKDYDVIEGDIMDVNLSNSIRQTFQIVLLGEILEHLKNPHQAVENLYHAFDNSTTLIVTTPNYASLSYMSASLHNTEMIHPDHYWYFSPVTLLKLFPTDRFELVEFNFGMYFQKDKKINFVLRQFPFLGECLMAVLKIKK